VAFQSFLKAGFLSAVQVELLFMIGGLHPVTKATRFQSFRNFVPKCDLTRYCIVGETRDSLWNATMVRWRRAPGTTHPKDGQVHENGAPTHVPKLR